MDLTGYVYTEGYDLHDVADTITDAIQAFIQPDDGLTFIDDRMPRTPDQRPEDLPEWNLGINFHFESVDRPTLTELLFFFHQLSHRTGRDFAFGLYDPERNTSEDVGYITSRRDFDYEIGRIFEGLAI